MRRYCRAYPLGDLRGFEGWRDPDGEPLADDAVVYLWDDLTVVASPVIPDSQVLWDTVGPGWERFCRDTLRFELPADLVDD